MSPLSRDNTKVLYKVLANPIKTAEHHEITYEKWVLGSMWQGRKVVSMDYSRSSNELWVLLEDGEEIEIRHVARKFYKPIENLDAITRDLYIRQEDIQEPKTSEQE